jgi:hypothetical protein
MSGPALGELQALFWRTLNGSTEPALEASVVSTPALRAADRLDIYARMYFWRLHDAIAEDFEKTTAVLGADRFADAVRAYLVGHPSSHPSIRHLGRHFAGFLQEAPPAGAPAWLPDLARLEWARVEVFDAPDATPIGREDLKAIDAADWPGLRLRPTGALEVVESAWPIHAIWQGGGDPPPSPTSLRVWREEGAVYHCPMDPLEREALAGLRSGASFGGICEALTHLDPDAAAAEAGSILARWLDDGLIVGMEMGNGAGEWSWEQSGG